MNRSLALIFLTLIFNVLPLQEASSAPLDPELESVLEEAAYLPRWLTLLHMDPTYLGGYKSRVDDPAFFVHPEGKYAPLLELRKYVELLLSGNESGDENVGCLFPARRKFVQSILSNRSLSEIHCPRFGQWYHRIAPDSITLVFPTSYLNNPASVFGHTLLRIDSKDTKGKNPLLAYTANFSASTNGENALFYAFKGIFGGFQGTYSVSPYYEQVVRYSDLERRDIWEYPLNLKPDEIETLVQHLWEVRGKKFDYYYFDENCSFQLLSLLEVARPGTSLIESFPISVLPIETVRRTLSEMESAGEAKLRPSLESRLKARVKESERETVRVASQIARTKDIPSVLPEMTLGKKASLYDLALEYREFLDSVEKSESADLRFELLARRSGLAISEVTPKPLLKENPAEGHGVARFGIGTSWEQDELVPQISWRPALHDLLDPSFGMDVGTVMEILSLDVSMRKSGMRLSEGTLFRASSLNPYDELFRLRSWRISADVYDLPVGEATLNGRQRVFQLEGGLGYTLGNQYRTFALFGAEAQKGTHFQDDFRIAPKLTVGFYLPFVEDFHLLAEGEISHGILGEQVLKETLRFGTSYDLADNLSVRIEGERTNMFHNQREKAGVNFLWYFDSFRVTTHPFERRKAYKPLRAASLRAKRPPEGGHVTTHINRQRD